MSYLVLPKVFASWVAEKTSSFDETLSILGALPALPGHEPFTPDSREVLAMFSTVSAQQVTSVSMWRFWVGCCATWNF